MPLFGPQFDGVVAAQVDDVFGVAGVAYQPVGVPPVGAMMMIWLLVVLPIAPDKVAQADAPEHETPFNLSSVVPETLGLGTIDQEVPFQTSAAAL